MRLTFLLAAASAAAYPIAATAQVSPIGIAAALPAAPARRVLLAPPTVMLRQSTPAETEANAVWSLRAGLNVAALQCQFSPFLDTVRTYNTLLKHHSGEFAAAQATMQVHFKRHDKARALNSFDQYSTRIYNSYSTLDAQYEFCDAAALAGKRALMLSKGGLGKYAVVATTQLRLALTPTGGPFNQTLADATPVVLPPVEG